MESTGPSISSSSFFSQDDVHVEELPYGVGVPLGLVQTWNAEVGLGGAYGSWGAPLSNENLPAYLEGLLEQHIADSDVLDLAPLGFSWRHHIQDLTEHDHYKVEIEVGRRLLSNAMAACGWEPHEIAGVLIGSSGPIAHDYTVQIARAVGIPESALKVSIHKACDSSMSGLHLALNPEAPANREGIRNIA